MEDQKRLTVSVGLGITLPVGEYGNTKPTIYINDIDPAKDITAQITTGIETGIRALVEIDNNLEVVLSQILAPETGIPAFKDRLKDVEAYQKTTKSNMKSLQVRLKDDKEIVAGLEARIRELESSIHGN